MTPCNFQSSLLFWTGKCSLIISHLHILFHQGKLAGSGGTVKVYSQQADKHWRRWSAKPVHLLAARMLACPSQSKSLGVLTVHPVKSFKGWSHSEGRLIHNNKKLFSSQNPFLALPHWAATCTVLPLNWWRNRGWKQIVTSASARLSSAASECQQLKYHLENKKQRSKELLQNWGKLILCKAPAPGHNTA